MSQPESMILIDEKGLRGIFKKMPDSTDAGEPQVLVYLDDGRRALVPAGALIKLKAGDDAGSYFLPFSLAELEQRQSTDAFQDEEGFVLPVVEEELQVSKREVETGRVRITKVVREREEVVDEPLLQEEINIERVEVNRIINEPVSIRYEGDTMIIPLVEEVLVVEKRLMLKKELRVTRRQTETQVPRQFTLRSEEAEIERLDAHTGSASD